MLFYRKIGDFRVKFRIACDDFYFAGDFNAKFANKYAFFVIIFSIYTVFILPVFSVNYDKIWIICHFN